MNSINPAISQPCISLSAGGADSANRPSAEEKMPETATDGFTQTGNSGSDAVSVKSPDCSAAPIRKEKIAAPAGETAPPCASQALGIAGKVAADCIGGPAGHVLGVTIESLKESQSEIEKGYHLPENFICGYYERRILPYQEHPTYTKTDDYLYRGMYITVDELANILKNGFEIKYNSWRAAGGQGIYLSSSMREADDYIFQSVDFNKKNALGVVFKMEKGDYAQLVQDPVLNAPNTIFKAPGDVPSDKIVEIYLRGQYGLERLGDIMDRARKDGIKPNNSWVNQFDSYLTR
ncbi:MAG: hypothetical protein AB9903_13185 [Vulcanimicrobiota bacterium]